MRLHVRRMKWRDQRVGAEAEGDTDRDALGLVLVLLRLEGELDEELLQLLVTVVNAELLEAATQNDTRG